MAISIKSLDTRVTTLENKSSGNYIPNYKSSVDVPFKSNWTATNDCTIIGCMGIWNNAHGYITVDGVVLWKTSGSNNSDYAGEVVFSFPVKKGSVVYLYNTYQSGAHVNMAKAFTNNLYYKLLDVVRGWWSKWL